MTACRLGLVVAMGLAILPVAAQAHKVIAAVYPAGSRIEGEIGFSNGSMAAGETVTVQDGKGRVLGTVTTDAQGMFLFTPTEVVDHVFHANLGAGHVARVTLPAADIARLLGKAVPEATPMAADAGGDDSTSSVPDTEVLAQMLRDELRPLRQELAAYKEKNDLQTILGGIGYILGVFGIGFYLAARRRLQG